MWCLPKPCRGPLGRGTAPFSSASWPCWGSADCLLTQQIAFPAISRRYWEPYWLLVTFPHFHKKVRSFYLFMLTDTLTVVLMGQSGPQIIFQSDDLWPFTHPGFVLSPMYVDYLGFVHYLIFLCHNSQIALHIARPLNLCICDCGLFVIKLPARQSLFFPWLTVVWYFILCACLNLFDLLSCTAQCEPSNAFVLMKSLGHEKQFTVGT